MEVFFPISLISFLILFIQIAIPVTIIYLLYKIYRKLDKLDHK